MLITPTYLRERAAPPMLLGAALLVLLASPPAPWPTATLRLAIATLVLLAWRVRDDLASVPHDRRHHPERLLSRTPAIEQHALWLLWAASLLTATLALTWLSDLRAALALTLASAALELLYEARPASPSPADLITLLKYPTLAAIVALPQPPDLAALTLLTCGLLTFELHDDARLSATLQPATPWLHAMITLTWGAALLWLTAPLPAPHTVALGTTTALTLTLVHTRRWPALAVLLPTALTLALR